MEPKLEKALVTTGVSCFIVGGLAGLVYGATDSSFGDAAVPVSTAVGYVLNRKSGFEYAIIGVVSGTVSYKIGYTLSRMAYEMLH